MAALQDRFPTDILHLVEELWIHPGVLLVAILASTFSLVGLVGLWAATSPRRWELRVAAVFGLLAPLLLVPAFEPFAILFTQAATVGLGIGSARLLRYTFHRRIEQSESNQFRYSLTTLLAITTFIAISSAILVSLPPYGWRVYGQIILDGVSLGWLTLLVAWLVNGRSRWWLRLFLVIPCIAATPWALEYANDDLLNFRYWGEDAYHIDDIGFYWEPRWGFLFVGAIPFAILLALTLFAIRRRAQLLAESATTPSLHRWTIAIAVLVLIQALFPAITLAKLLNKTSVPQIALPTPNGHDDIMAAWKLLRAAPNGPYLVDDHETATVQELSQAIDSVPEAFNRARLGLDREIRVPFHYESQSDTENAYEWYDRYLEVAWALVLPAELAEREKRWQEASAYHLKRIELEFACSRGGPWNAYFAWLVIPRLYGLREHLSEAECRGTVSKLLELDATREPFEDLFTRERAWRQRINGWNGHLEQIVFDAAGDRRSRGRMDYNLKTSIFRLLIAEYAIQVYQLREDSLPASIDRLVPDILPDVPQDPFDPAGGPLRYKKTADGYILYSVSQDGKDNGGIPPNHSYHLWWYADGCDLRLDYYFADEP